MELAGRRKRQEGLRAIVNRWSPRLEEEMGKSPRDIGMIRYYFGVMAQPARKLMEVDGLVEESLAEAPLSDNDRAEEDRIVHETLCVFHGAEQFLRSLEAGEAATSAAVVSQPGTSKVNYPRLQLPKFDGGIKNWLSFWAQFSKIDSDAGISNLDKLAYLRDAMVPGTSAASLVEGYVSSGEGYVQAINHLKSRFGKDSLLIETYMRELLALVLKNHSGEGLQLQELYDQLRSHLGALDTLGLSVEKYAAMLMPLVESALPDDVLKAWERQPRGVNEGSEHDLPTLMNFVQREVEREEHRRITRMTFAKTAGPPTAATLYSGAKDKDRDTKQEGGRTSSMRGGVGTSSTGADKGGWPTYGEACIFCDKASHSSSECCKIRGWPHSDRMELLKQKRACFVCLKPAGHLASACRVTVKCLVCTGRHYTIICQKLAGKPATTSKKPPTSLNFVGGPREKTSDNVMIANSEAGTTLLQTLRVTACCGDRARVTRVLLDSGSQRSYVAKSLVVDLGLSSSGGETLCHSLFGGTETQQKAHNRYQLTLQGMSVKSTFKLSALDEERICNYIPRLSDQGIIKRLECSKIVLSDVGPCPAQVEILIGADVLGNLLTGLSLKLGGGLMAVETVLGWTVMGPTYSTRQEGVVVDLANITFDLQDLWRLETLGIKDVDEQAKQKGRKEEAAELLQVHVNEEGRYEVALPWIDPPTLVCNRLAAEKRLGATTRKLEKSGKFSDYDKVFREWLDMGIIERVPEEEDKDEGFYLPHRAVIKESSETTKIRPVFDASAKDYNGVSLNSRLEAGPNLIEDTLALLLNFRKGLIGVTADIAKAFLQISVIPSDRKYLKFLWWESEEKKHIVAYRHKRVVFGVTSSPFLLNATIEHHLSHATGVFKQVAEKLKGSFYMDNVVTSVNSRKELETFVRQAKELMKLGKFDLRQWASGPEFLVPIELPCEPLSILGVHWDRELDEMFVNRSVSADESPLTRRKLLSLAHSFFDPLGIISPYTLWPKRVLQEVWASGGTWDSELPASLADKVTRWLKGAELISKCRIARELVKDWNSKELSLHVFCDASQDAYAACIFFREVILGTARITFVLAKSRVAPRKPAMSIPRLELMAAVIGVRLSMAVQQAVNISGIPRFYWTDSQVILSWIQKGKDWANFVGRRCAEIRKFTKSEEWFYIPGALNPADLPSRGCTAKALLESRWWEGPTWLRSREEDWPKGQGELQEQEVNEMTKEILQSKGIVCVQVQTSRESHLPRFSSFKKNVNVVVRMMRWRTHKKEDRLLPITSEEWRDAEIRIFTAVQKEFFTVGSKFAKDREICTDESGVMRLKTRLTFGEDTYSFKNPILLPGNSRIVQAYLQAQHLALSHAGVQTMMATLRERFWITDCRRVIKRTVRGCKSCRRHSAKPVDTPFTPLPEDRIRAAAVFEVTGIDYAGPLYLKGEQKAWVVLFTCAVYRAVHLELVTTLTTAEFLEALRRFIARRGRPSVIYSDNGTQFQGANAALKAIDWGEVVEKTALPQVILWKFSPPLAPWWGGFWERMIRMMKELLRRNLGRATLAYSELATVLCDVEATVNARPLTHYTDDSLKPLTPACFLRSIESAGVQDLDQVVRNGLNQRLKYLLRLREGLRERFRTEYLGLLINVGRRSPGSLKPGDVVLVGNHEGKKRIDWPLGLVLSSEPGKDGYSRVAKVRVAGKREIIRPFRSLYPLEVGSEEEIEVLQPTPAPQTEKKTVTTRSGREVRKPLRFQPGVAGRNVAGSLQ